VQNCAGLEFQWQSRVFTESMGELETLGANEAMRASIRLVRRGGHRVVASAA